jgi:hypothetical protein
VDCASKKSSKEQRITNAICNMDMLNK